MKDDRNKLALKTGVWYVVSSVVVKAAAIITTPVFTRILSQEEYGITSNFVAWYTILLPVFSLNLSYSIGRAKLDFEGELDEYIGSMQLLAGIFSVCLSGLAFLLKRVLVPFMGLTDELYLLLIVYLLFEPAITFAQNGFRYRYMYRQNIGIAWYIAFGQIVLSLLLLISAKGNGAVLRAAGIVLPVVVLSICFWAARIAGGRLKPRRNFWKYGVCISAPLIIHSLSLNILSQSDRIFITNLCGERKTAIYSLVYTYSLMISVITTGISDGWLPWFHDNYFEGNYEEIRRNVKKIVILGCYISLACIAVAPEAILILGGRNYLEGLNCVPPVVLGVTCQFIYTHYVNIELHMKKTLFVSLGTIVAALMNIFLNEIFIRKYGYIAAAYTTLASYIMLMGIHFMITRKVLKIRLYNDRFMFGALTVTTVAAVVLRGTYSIAIVRYGSICIGMLSFIGIFHKEIISFADNWKKKWWKMYTIFQDYLCRRRQRRNGG